MKARLAATAVLLLLLMMPAGVAQAQTPSRGSDPGLSSCIQAAIASRAQAWVCMPAGLTIVTDSLGRTVNAFTPMPTSVLVTGRESSSLAVADDYDTWCENGSVCNRKISTYIAETKGNGAYGNQSGVIGAYDVILRTNLNGRQAQWKVSLIRDLGPTLNFTEVYVNCWEEIAFWPDNNCGNHFAGAPRVSGRWNSGTLYGNRLNNSNEYYGAVSGRFTPDGYPSYVLPVLEGMYFNCYGTSNCVFP